MSRSNVAVRTALYTYIVKQSGMTYEEHVQSVIQSDFKNFIFRRSEMDLIMTFYTPRSDI